jgi:exonuclease VII large subunit
MSASLNVELKARATSRVDQIRRTLAADATQKYAAYQQAVQEFADRSADAAKAHAHADSAANQQQALNTLAQQTAAAVTNKYPNADGLHPPDPADKLVKAAAQAQAQADQATQIATGLRDVAIEADTRLALARASADAARTAADAAKAAATGAGGPATISDINQLAAAAAVPLGPNGAPLDTPPPP